MKTQADRIECAQCRQKVKAQTARKYTPIPLHETPIYAEMMAEFWREEFYGWKTRVLLGVDQTRSVDQYTITRKPLAPKGRRK